MSDSETAQVVPLHPPAQPKQTNLPGTIEINPTMCAVTSARAAYQLQWQIGQFVIAQCSTPKKPPKAQQLCQYAEALRNATETILLVDTELRQIAALGVPPAAPTASTEASPASTETTPSVQ